MDAPAVVESVDRVDRDHPVVVGVDVDGGAEVALRLGSEVDLDLFEDRAVGGAGLELEVVVGAVVVEVGVGPARQQDEGFLVLLVEDPDVVDGQSAPSHRVQRHANGEAFTDRDTACVGEGLDVELTGLLVDAVVGLAGEEGDEHHGGGSIASKGGGSWSQRSP